MKQKIGLSILLNFLFISFSLAQQLNTKVLIYGSGPGALSAGIQSARSGVKTLLIAENAWQEGSDLLAKSPIMQSGIWAEFVKNYLGKTENNPVLIEKIVFSSDSAEKILKLMSDTVKRLNKLALSEILSIKKSGKGWDIRLKNGQKIKTHILVDASSDHRLLKKIETKLPEITETNSYLFRTSVAAVDTFKTLPLVSLVAEKTENVIAVPIFNSRVSSMHAGQAAGAAAAFCAFFNTSTKNLNVRLIQNELLTYKASLIPFGDILPSDSNFVKIQHLGLSGLMDAGIQKNNGIRYWKKDHPVSTDELKNLMKSFYSRSQIWFADHRAEKISITQAIDLLMYTATRGEELRREIERGWQTRWGFKNAFDPQRPIGRMEFALLAENYLQPFNVQVDLQGNLLN